MATNQYFVNDSQSITGEQLLFEDLIIEAIKQYGVDVYYLPRSSLDAQDLLYGEDPVSAFNASYGVEVYINSVHGPADPSEFFSRAGLEIRDSIKVTIARRVFLQYVPGLPRPREGDLLWMPGLNSLYEIKFVEEEKDYHTLGRRAPFFYFFELHLELFKFSNERFNTGFSEVDENGRDYSYTIALNMNSSGAGAYITGEQVYQGPNAAYAICSAHVKDWDRKNYILQVVNIKGTFTSNINVTGNSSGAVYVTNSYDGQDFSNVLEELANNEQIQQEADQVINFDPDNPFGSP